MRSTGSGAVLAFVWGVLLALILCRHVFFLEVGTFFKNDESTGYLLRQIQFEECISSGYLSPQWCSFFRSGLGSPYFSFYQSGWFYFSCLFAWCPSVVLQFAFALVAMHIIGYWGMFRLVESRFGTVSGLLSATFLLCAEYPATDVWIRGDFSEFASMMLVPSWFLGLIDHSHSNSTNRIDTANVAKRSWLLPWTTGAIAVTHPCVAMQVAIVGVFVIAMLFAVDRNVRRLLFSMLSLVAGIGLAGLFWVTWIGEVRYVQPGLATEGFFHFSKNFVAISDLFNASQTGTVTNVKFGVMQTILLVVATVSSLAFWKRWNSSQRIIVACSFLILAISLFLISPESNFLWSRIRLLQFQQFPWRFLAMMTISASMLVGTLGCRSVALPWKIISVLALTLAVLLRISSVSLETIEFDEPKSAREIALHHFSPDGANEWLPQGASEFAFGEPLQKTYTGPTELVFSNDGSVIVHDASLSNGNIHSRVISSKPATLTIRHYFYPVGWQARLAGTPTPIQRSPEGLMQIQVPANFDGSLAISFSTTPMRKLGLVVSLLTCALLIARAFSSFT